MCGSWGGMSCNCKCEQLSRMLGLCAVLGRHACCMRGSPTAPSLLPHLHMQGGEGRPGLPASVLVGHTGPAAFVDFHPWLPDALLSASFDGTCRIWRARDAAAPPVVLRVDPDQFGLAAQAAAR